MNLFHRIRGAKRRGVALVITLSILVLMTVLVMAFFSRSSLNRQIAFTSTSQIKTDLLARNALNIITGELRDEISSTDYSTLLTSGTPTLYKPKTAADSVPKKVGVSNPDMLGGATLLKVSASGTGVRPDGSSVRVGSTVDISTRSINGRSISSTRWFGSYGPQLGSQAKLPVWMLITRGNGIKVPAIADAKTTSSNDFVIGRFAFTVYDLGGLMNANVAGYPSNANGLAGYKSSQVYADLSAVGVSASNVTSFLAWRNAMTSDTATFTEWATGIPHSAVSGTGAALAAAQSGYLSAAVGDNAILSRRDLLNHPYLASSAEALTHFSRSLNAPSFIPVAATGTNPNIPDVRFTTSGTVTHYRDDGVPETYPVLAGDSLLQRRFSLRKLAWIGPSGPNTDAFNASLTGTQQKQAIADCFGLQWNDTDKNWAYVAANENDDIKTLSELTSGMREPNLFELIKAGILDGSLGKAATNTTVANSEQNVRDGVQDLQIIRIGANMIDCADSDDYPTTISFSIGGTAIPVHGVEDLPYLYGLVAGDLWSVTKVDGTSNQLDWCTMFLSPVLYNPHRSGMNNTAAPSSIRVRIASGSVVKIYNPNDSLHLTRTPSEDLSSRSAIEIPQSSYSNFQAYPKVVKGSYASTTNTRLDQLVASSHVDSDHGDIHAFVYYNYTGLPETFPIITTANPTATGAGFRTQMDNVLVVVEYKDASGNWRIYDSLGGNEAFTAAGTGLNGIVDWGVATQPVTGAGGVTKITRTNPDKAVNNNLSAFLGKLDPRTSRFGVSRSVGLNTTSTQPLMATSVSGMYWNGGFRYQMPFASGNAGSTGANFLDVYPARWVQGGKTDWSDTDTDPSGISHASEISNIHDRDMTVRPADLWLASYPTSNPFYTPSDNTLRPVVLNRPFRSVGELGYVFRDTPWKTLSFFDETSADSALLDLFSLSDEPRVTAARISLNANLSAPYQALIQGVAQEPDGTALLDSGAGAALASAYSAYTYSNGMATTQIPRNAADLPTFMYSGTVAGTLKNNANLDSIKTHREALIRALGGATQSRTWNLLIDVVAQSGRYPQKASSLSDFYVDGERRYWLSVAIDRYTGTVISQQLEPVNE